MSNPGLTNTSPVVSLQIAPTALESPVQAATVIEAPVVASTVETTPAVSLEASVAPKAETVLGNELDKPVVAPVVAPVETVPQVEEIKAQTPEGVDKTEGGQSDEPAPPPKYEAFIVPEGITLEPERLGKFTEILSELEVKSKAEHALVQEFGQKAVDFHVSEIKNAVETVQKSYQDAWDNQKVEWKNSFLNDPEMGGNRFQTTVDSALSFIRTHGGTPEQQLEFRNLMETSGLGNHPAMIRLLAKAGQSMSEGKPLAAPRPVSEPKSKTKTLYGNSHS